MQRQKKGLSVTAPFWQFEVVRWSGLKKLGMICRGEGAAPALYHSNIENGMVFAEKHL